MPPCMEGVRPETCDDCRHFGGWIVAALARCDASGGDISGYEADGCQDFEIDTGEDEEE